MFDLDGIGMDEDLDNCQTSTELAQWIVRHGMIDGAHHKQWIIDQILRKVLQQDYPAFIESYDADPDEVPWDIGIAP